MSYNHAFGICEYKGCIIYRALKWDSSIISACSSLLDFSHVCDHPTAHVNCTTLVIQLIQVQ